MNNEARVILITGAGGGLGQALTHEFGQQGWQVVAGHRSANAGGAASSHADGAASLPGRIWDIVLDVTDQESVANAVDQTLKRWGRIDALINNAGIVADDLSVQMEEVCWDRVLAVNLKGAFLCARAACRAMVKQRDGHIVNISSFSGRAGQRGQANYAAAKAGLLGLTTSLARELGSRNVRVNAVLPGVLPTRMTAGLDEPTLRGLAAANALGRINSLDEVARFIAFLAGTRNISGQVFQLDSRIAPWT